MATRREKSMRDIYEQMMRLQRDDGGNMPTSLEQKRNADRNRRIQVIANRYKQNMHNAINRMKGGSNIPIEQRLDMKFDRSIYTRATAAGSQT